jgi:hypothetical protein
MGAPVSQLCQIAVLTASMRIPRRVYRMGWNAIDEHHRDQAARTPPQPVPPTAVRHNPHTGIRRSAPGNNETAPTTGGGC